MTLAGVVAGQLNVLADPEKARGLAAYMKTDMPFYGVMQAGRKPIVKWVIRESPPADDAEYRRNVLTLWSLPHREEKYIAIAYARGFPRFVKLPHIDLYRRLIIEGAWWDFVDDVASRLVGAVVRANRVAMRPTLAEWVDHEDMWLRRTAIICQLQHGGETDPAMLFDFCRRRAHDKEFFIRKAIGWALRQYARTDPEAVRSFLTQMGDELSGLSRREAGKWL